MSTIDPDTGETTEEFTEIEPKTPGRRGRRAYPRDANGNIIRPDGSIGKAPGRPRSAGKSLESQLDGFVSLINMLVSAFKPNMALDPIEKTALVKALDQQCQISPRFRKAVEKLLIGGGGVNLVGVVALIAVRRVARAEVIPLPADAPIKSTDIDNMAGAMLTALTAKSFTGVNVS